MMIKIIEPRTQCIVAVANCSGFLKIRENSIVVDNYVLEFPSEVVVEYEDEGLAGSVKAGLPYIISTTKYHSVLCRLTCQTILQVKDRMLLVNGRLLEFSWAVSFKEEKRG